MKIRKITLTSLHDREMTSREEAALKGGGCLWCSCPCKYAGPKEDERELPLPITTSQMTADGSNQKRM